VSYNPAEGENNFKKIIALYDSAEELLQTVENQTEVDPEVHLDAVEPLIDAIEESADILSKEYSHLAEGVSGKSKINKRSVEGSIRKVFLAMNEYKDRLKKQSKPVAQAITKMTDGVISKLKKTIEDVVVVFLEVIDLGIEKLLQKQELEEMKKRNLRIAALMHNHSLAAQH